MDWHPEPRDRIPVNPAAPWWSFDRFAPEPPWYRELWLFVCAAISVAVGSAILYVAFAQPENRNMEINVNGRTVVPAFVQLAGTELRLQFTAPDTGRRYTLELELELAPFDHPAALDELERRSAAEAQAAADRAHADPNVAAAQQGQQPDPPSPSHHPDRDEP